MKMVLTPSIKDGFCVADEFWEIYYRCFSLKTGRLLLDILQKNNPEIEFEDLTLN